MEKKYYPELFNKTTQIWVLILFYFIFLINISVSRVPANRYLFLACVIECYP